MRKTFYQNSSWEEGNVISKGRHPCGDKSQHRGVWSQQCKTSWRGAGRGRGHEMGSPGRAWNHQEAERARHSPPPPRCNKASQCARLSEASDGGQCQRLVTEASDGGQGSTSNTWDQRGPAGGQRARLQGSVRDCQGHRTARTGTVTKLPSPRAEEPQPGTRNSRHPPTPATTSPRSAALLETPSCSAPPPAWRSSGWGPVSRTLLPPPPLLTFSRLRPLGSGLGWPRPGHPPFPCGAHSSGGTYQLSWDIIDI